MNKKEIALSIVIFLIIWAVSCLLYTLSHDSFRQDENKDLYCKNTYGDEFSYPSDAHSNIRICTKINNDSEFVGYYFTKEDQEKYCNESFWKLNDCDGKS